MTGQHITASARLGLPLMAILGLVLTGTEVQRLRLRRAQLETRSLDGMSGQGVFYASRFNAEATRRWPQ